MKPKRIFVDVDGTLTQRQTPHSVRRGVPLRADVVAKVRALAEQGHEIIIWTGSTKGAREVVKLLNLPHIAAVGKPDVIVDNQAGSFGRRLKRRVILPEDFVNYVPEEKP